MKKLTSQRNLLLAALFSVQNAAVICSADVQVDLVNTYIQSVLGTGAPEAIVEEGVKQKRFVVDAVLDGAGYQPDSVFIDKLFSNDQLLIGRSTLGDSDKGLLASILSTSSKLTIDVIMNDPYESADCKDAQNQLLRSLGGQAVPFQNEIRCKGSESEKFLSTSAIYGGKQETDGFSHYRHEYPVATEWEAFGAASLLSDQIMSFGYGWEAEDYVTYDKYEADIKHFLAFVEENEEGDESDPYFRFHERVWTVEDYDHIGKSFFSPTGGRGLSGGEYRLRGIGDWVQIGQDLIQDKPILGHSAYKEGYDNEELLYYFEHPDGQIDKVQCRVGVSYYSNGGGFNSSGCTVYPDRPPSYCDIYSCRDWENSSDFDTPVTFINEAEPVYAKRTDYADIGLDIVSSGYTHVMQLETSYVEHHKYRFYHYVNGLVPILMNGITTMIPAPVLKYTADWRDVPKSLSLDGGHFSIRSGSKVYLACNGKEIPFSALNFRSSDTGDTGKKNAASISVYEDDMIEILETCDPDSPIELRFDNLYGGDLIPGYSNKHARIILSGTSFASGESVVDSYDQYLYNRMVTSERELNEYYMAYEDGQSNLVKARNQSLALWSLMNEFQNDPSAGSVVNISDYFYTSGDLAGIFKPVVEPSFVYPDWSAFISWFEQRSDSLTLLPPGKRLDMIGAFYQAYDQELDLFPYDCEIKAAYKKFTDNLMLAQWFMSETNYDQSHRVRGELNSTDSNSMYVRIGDIVNPYNPNNGWCLEMGNSL